MPWWFEVLIIANGIMIGFQTSPQYEDWDGWIYLESAFIIFLLLEMGLRMRLLRCKNYWCGVDRLWNFFDSFLAASGIADIAVQAFSHQNPDIPATSLLRFCRLIRHGQQQKWTKTTCRCLEPQTTIYKWLFQLDDEPNLYIEKRLEITKDLFINGWPWGSSWWYKVAFSAFP